MRKKIIIVAIGLVSLALIGFLLFQLIIPETLAASPEKISYAEFLEWNEAGKIGAICYKSKENIIYGLLTNSAFPVERILESYDFWVEDVPSEAKLWGDVEASVESKDGNYGFVMRFSS